MLIHNRTIDSEGKKLRSVGRITFKPYLIFSILKFKMSLILSSLAENSRINRNS